MLHLARRGEHRETLALLVRLLFRGVKGHVMDDELEKIKQYLTEYLTAWAAHQKNEMHALFKEEALFLGIKEPRNTKEKELEDALFSQMHGYISEGEFFIAMNYLRLNETEISSYAAMLNKQRTSEETKKETKTNFSKLAASARHLPTYAKRDKIISYWRDNIGAHVSNEVAAEQLQKQFPDVAHRTLARYVSEAKRIPPAGIL